MKKRHSPLFTALSLLTLLATLKIYSNSFFHKNHNYPKIIQPTSITSHPKRLITTPVPHNAAPPENTTQKHGIQHAFYINLAHRTDRNQDFRIATKHSNIPFTRLEAYDFKKQDPEAIKHCYDKTTCPGSMGCQRSHLHALETALTNKWPHVAIFEDDFVFNPHVDKKLVQTAIQKVMDAIPQWDVIGLTFNIHSKTPWTPEIRIPFSTNKPPLTVVRIIDAQTSGGYIVNAKYIQTLVSAISFKNCPTNRSYQIAIDMCWKPLQRTGNWITLYPQVGTQKPSFSDIENVYVHYSLNN